MKVTRTIIKEGSKSINEYDQAKAMLNFLREDFNQQDTGGNVFTPTINTNEKDDAITLRGSELKAEEDAFGEHVTQDVVFDKESFKIYPNDYNVTWSGRMGRGIEWRLSKNDDVVIKANNVSLEDRDMEMIENLKKYSDNWADEWAKKLRTDYKTRDDQF